MVRSGRRREIQARVARPCNRIPRYVWCSCGGVRGPKCVVVGDGGFATAARDIAGLRGECSLRACCADCFRDDAAVKDQLRNIRRNTEQPLCYNGVGGELRLLPMRKILGGEVGGVVKKVF